MGCEVTCVGATDLNNVPYISAKVTCTINFSEKEIWLLRLKIWMCSFFERNKYLTENDYFIGKENTNVEAVNNAEEYFREHENICFMVFLKNMFMTSSHIVFNIIPNLINEQYYPLHVKTTSFSFTFVLVIVNAIIFD